MKSINWKVVALLILCWSLAATSLATYYYMLYTLKPPPAELGTVVLFIDYANGTLEVYNLTLTFPTSLYNITKAVALIEYRTFPGVPGIFIESINNVRNDWEIHRYWIWWIWNTTTWVEGPLAVDLYRIETRQILCWYYSKFDPNTFAVEKPKVKIQSKKL